MATPQHVSAHKRMCNAGVHAYPGIIVPLFFFFFFWSWEQTQGLLLARQGLHHQG